MDCKPLTPQKNRFKIQDLSFFFPSNEQRTTLI